MKIYYNYSEVDYLNLEIDGLQMSLGHQSCFGSGHGKAETGLYGNGGVPVRTLTLKLGSARGTRYRVF